MKSASNLCELRKKVSKQDVFCEACITVSIEKADRVAAGEPPGGVLSGLRQERKRTSGSWEFFPFLCRSSVSGSEWYRLSAPQQGLFIVT